MPHRSRRSDLAGALLAVARRSGILYFPLGALVVGIPVAVIVVPAALIWAVVVTVADGPRLAAVTVIPGDLDAFARWRGALAGLVPVIAVALLFAVGGTAASRAEVAVSPLVGLIATAAGWFGGAGGGCGATTPARCGLLPTRSRCLR